MRSKTLKHFADTLFLGSLCLSCILIGALVMNMISIYLHKSEDYVNFIALGLLVSVCVMLLSIVLDIVAPKKAQREARELLLRNEDKLNDPEFIFNLVENFGEEEVLKAVCDLGCYDSISWPDEERRGKIAENYRTKFLR